MSRAPVLIPDKPGRRYVWPPEGEPEHVVPSVTTVLNNVAKQEWLVPAAGWRVAEYAVENILRWEGLPAGDAKQMLAGVARRDWNQKARLGTDVHKAIDDAIAAWRGEEPTVDLNEKLTPYLAGAFQFLNDHVARVIHTEEVVYNLTYQYAGRVDCIAALNDGPVAVVDWKSGKVDSDMALQLNAYAHAEFVGREDGTQITLPPIEAGYVVQLPGDGTYIAHPVAITSRAFKTFVAYRTVQEWSDRHADDALDEPVVGGEPAAPTN